MLGGVLGSFCWIGGREGVASAPHYSAAPPILFVRRRGAPLFSRILDAVLNHCRRLLCVAGAADAGALHSPEAGGPGGRAPQRRQGLLGRPVRVAAILACSPAPP